MCVCVRERERELSHSSVSRSFDIDAKDEAGATALIYAARGGHVETIKYLVAHGASVRDRRPTQP